jgi:Helix-turn-helix domain
MSKRLSIQSHPHILPPTWPRPGGAAVKGDGSAFDWAVLVSRVVHPVQVAIVEALLWISHPLSASDLRDIFDEPSLHYLSIVSYHLRKLEEFGVLRETGTRPVRGAVETFYFFPQSTNGKAVE